jgi:hypothetical protein
MGTNQELPGQPSRELGSGPSWKRLAAKGHDPEWGGGGIINMEMGARGQEAIGATHLSLRSPGAVGQVSLSAIAL